jgi:hypothetical protein
MDRIVECLATALHFRFGWSADPDYRDAAGQFRQTFFELFAVGFRLGDLLAEFLAPALDLALLAFAADVGGVFTAPRPRGPPGRGVRA